VSARDTEDHGAVPPPGDTARTLAAARFHWQTGDWPALACLALPERSDGPSPPEAVELLLYRMEAAFQTGDTEQGRELAGLLHREGVPVPRLVAALLSGAASALARSWLLLDDPSRAADALNTALLVHPESAAMAPAATLRMEQELRRLRHDLGLPLPRCRTEGKLFIDCGGFDGCSALMFLLSEPAFDCVTFEPNPDLWKHYADIPTRLIRKAAYVFDGEIAFTIDPVDGDGSTLVAGKRIDFTQTVPDADCPVIKVACVDLSTFVRQASRQYGTIILKLDVEGAEYEILEKMLDDGTIDLIDTLYCEFHGDKLSITDKHHNNLVRRVAEHVEIRYWDALPLSFSIKDTPSLRSRRRAEIIRAIRHHRERIETSGYG
jgi:FkbM family methyltransferase